MASLPRPSNDTTITWAQSHSVSSSDPNARGTLRPNLVLRFATTSSYVLHNTVTMDNHAYATDAKALMNLTLPGQRLFGVISWSASETVDSPVHTATFEATNALPISQINSTLTSGLPARWHSATAVSHWVSDNNGVTVSVNGTQPVSYYGYSEDQVLFREMADEAFTVLDASQFPDPRVPSDETDDITWAPTSSTGVGAYYVLVGNEVMRVYNKSGNALFVPCGGRGVNGIIEDHQPGATVQVLGFEPVTGRWAGLGYMTAYESAPYRSLLRPGQCLVSYEGYGDFDTGALTKNNWGVDFNSDGGNRGYEFTGYWFTGNTETTLASDGVAKMSCNLSSAGYILTHQKITPNAVFRLSSDIANYAQSAFGSANYTRRPVIKNIGAGDRAWNPASPNAYPLQVKTEYAQHKAFFEHMRDTTNGKDCEFCQEEYNTFVSRPGYKINSDPIREARVVGKHIYQESILVDRGSNGPFDSGPLRTFGSLMIYLAKVAWDTPMVGAPLGDRWSKIPNQLWANMETMTNTGLVWNGQMSFRFDGETDAFLWEKQEYHDYNAWPHKDPLTCPFESSYDKQDWYQPLAELADMNRMTFLFDRRGNPVMIPKGLRLRGRSWRDQNNPQQNNGDWHLGWGGSVESYSHNLDSEGVLTLVWVSGTTAFDSDFSITAAGTTWDGGTNKMVWHSSKVGNTEGLQYTGGVQQIDTVSLDNQVLGLDWNTDPASYSLTLDRTADKGGLVQISRFPDIPTHKLKKGDQDNRKDSARGFQRLYNFLRSRFYINPARDTSGNYIDLLEVDGKYGNDEVACCKVIQSFLRNQGYTGLVPDTDGIWTSHEAQAMKFWIRKNQDFIKNDVWYYALAGYEWQYYVAAVTGLQIPQNKDDESSSEDAAWTVDQLALRKKVETWQEQFLKHAINIGNQVVDESINKASVRQVGTNIADPRIQVGDTLALQIPGFLSAEDAFGNASPPFNNVTYITQVTRNMDLQNGTYTATYAGYRYRDLGSFVENKENFFA